jgi:molybdenum cofactor cytidylyltransferase
MNRNARSGPHVLILAAGFSSRLGRPKTMVRLRGQSLLRRTLALAARIAPTTIVMLPRRADRYRTEARGFKVIFAANPQRALGLSSSVRRGIAKGRYAPALLLLPVDLPDLRDRDLARLISRWRATRRRVIARCIEGDGGAVHAGVPLILPRWLYPRVLALTGDIGLRALVGGLPAPQRALVHVPSAALDIDTPEDLRAARRRFRRSGVNL